MIDLFVLCEGQTEMEFTRELLFPLLRQRKGWGLITPIKLGGHHTYARLKKDVAKLLSRRQPTVRVTTMVDLYKLAGDFPDCRESWDMQNPYHRVEFLEDSFGKDIADERFVPYIQLYEFEALLFADIRRLARIYPHYERALGQLADRIDKEFPSPEHVDRLLPPSKRILQVIPTYSKPVAGNVTAIEIGIPRIRERCKHFHSWLMTLELLAAAPETAP